MRDTIARSVMEFLATHGCLPSTHEKTIYESAFKAGWNRAREEAIKEVDERAVYWRKRIYIECAQKLDALVKDMKAKDAPVNGHSEAKE